MIKIIKENGKTFVRIKDVLHQCIYDKKIEKIFVLYEKKFLLELTPEGRCLSKLPINQNTVEYMVWNTGICWNPPYYVNNKRTCHGCDHIKYCQCDLNVEKFNFEVEEEDGQKRTEKSDELSRNCDENDPHEPKASENVQEQPEVGGVGRVGS